MGETLNIQSTETGYSCNYRAHGWAETVIEQVDG